MTWSRVTATGSGAVRFRVSPEGSPFEFVTHADMETTTGGRSRYVGLSSDGIKIVEKVDLVRAHWEPEGIRIRIADIANRATELFAKRPTLVALLDADMDSSDTTLTVTGVAGGWGDEGYLHLDRETMAYETVDATTFTVTRARWGTSAAAHYTADGERLRYPEVTDWPVLWTGRRTKLYAYGPGDSATGDGTLIWTGIMSGEPRFNGVEWSFSLDPLSSILDTTLGADLADPVPIRGIYYPATAPLHVDVYEAASTTKALSFSAGVHFAMAGFWENQSDFLVDFNANLTTEITNNGSFTQTLIRGEPHGDSWAVRFETTGSPKWIQVEIWSATDGVGGNPIAAASPDAGEVDTVTASKTYLYRQTLGLGTVPRATIGWFDPGNLSAGLAATHQYDLDPATWPTFRIYLGGTSAVTSNTTAVRVEWATSGRLQDVRAGSLHGPGTEPFTTTIESVSTSDRYIEITRPSTMYVSVSLIGGLHVSQAAAYYAATAAGLPKIRQGRHYGTGSLNTFLTNLTLATADFVNTGAAPDIRGTDINTSAGEIAAAVAGWAYGQNRLYTIFSDQSLKDYLEQECRLIGVFPCLDSSGLIAFRRLRLPTLSETEDHTIDASKAIMSDQWVSYEKSPLGIFNTVVLRTGYDPISDEYSGDSFVIRDVAAFGQAPTRRPLEITPMSGDPPGGATFDDVLFIGKRVLGVFGGPYAYVTIDVPLTMFGVLLGDAVSITYGKVPEDDGTMGVTGKIGLVVGREWEIRKARGRLTLLVTEQRIGGYVPAAKITSISGVSGGTGPFTLTIDNTDYLDTSRAQDNWTAGDKIRLFEWDSTNTGDNTTGTVTGTPADTQITITTDATWVYDRGATWVIGAQVSTSIAADGQRVYVYIGNADATVDWSDDNVPAFTFAP